jgi:hypothetical protein
MFARFWVKPLLLVLALFTTFSTFALGSQSTQAAELASPYGIYPDCIAPAIGVESHSWWTEPGEDEAHAARHIHMGACVPNARDTTGERLSVSGSLPLVLRVVSFNNPAKLEWIEAKFGDGTGFQKIFVNNLCQQMAGEHKECTWYYPMTVDLKLAGHNGLGELRLRPNFVHPDLNNERQFTTLNFQVYVKDSRFKSTSNYRSSPNPIARSWYDLGFDYANADLGNYIQLLGTDLSKNMPVLKGTVTLKGRHREATGKVSAKMTLDPNYHAGVVGRTLYQYGANGDYSVQLDTTKLTNGKHVLMVETAEETSLGTQRGQIKLEFLVQN